MDIREINTILIEPVDELFFEKNEVVYRLTEPLAQRRNSQSLQRRSPRATYARPRPPARYVSGPLKSEAKAMHHARITEPLARHHRPNTPALVVPVQRPSAVAPLIPPVPMQPAGLSVYFLLVMVLIIGVLGGIGFGYLLSASQSLPAQLSFSFTHHLELIRKPMIQ